MQAVIMAGGKGTRLRSVTGDELPKPLAPILGEPILQWQIECLREGGVSEILLVVGYLGHKIEEFFSDGSAFGVHITYFHEETPLGTAGALALIKERLEPVFWLVFGDVIFDIDLTRMQRFHQEKKALATLFVHPNSHPFDSDLLVMDETGAVLEMKGKDTPREGWYHNQVNAGFYLLDRAVCNEIQKNVKTGLEKDVLLPLAAKTGRVYGYASPEYIKDVGTPERIAAAARDLDQGIVTRRSLRNPQRCVFLDRDGTVNEYRGLVSREEDFVLDPHAAEAIRMLNENGWLAIVVTNQPVVARGLCDIETVERIHAKMETLLGREGAYLDGCVFCPHHPDKGYPEENPAYKISCDCRKPKTGLVDGCAARFHIDLSQSWMVGDTTVDLQTGVNAGLHTALVMTGEAGRDGKYPCVPELIGANLLDAVEQIIKMGG